MRGIGAIAAIAVLAAGCTGSGGSTVTPSSTAPPPTTFAPTSAPVSTPVSTPNTSAPPTTGVPSDVPTTGPNTKPGEKPPLMPAAARQHTPAGAAAFARFYVATLDWAYGSMSGAYPRHLSATVCAACTSVLATIDRSRSTGYRYIGGRFTGLTSRVRSKPAVRNAEVTAIVTFDVSAFEVVDRAGKVLDGQPAHHHYRFEVSLSWAVGTWQVVDLGLDR